MYMYQDNEFTLCKCTCTCTCRLERATHNSLLQITEYKRKKTVA